MEPTEPITAAVWEGSHPYLMARVVVRDDTDARPVVQADVEAILVSVFDSGEWVGPVDVDGDGVPLELTVASVVFDALQTGDVWTTDATGFNFAFALDGTVYLSDGGRVYRVQAEFELTGGEKFPVVWMLTAQNIVGQ